MNRERSVEFVAMNTSEKKSDDETERSQETIKNPVNQEDGDPEEDNGE